MPQSSSPCDYCSSCSGAGEIPLQTQLLLWLSWFVWIWDFWSHRGAALLTVIQLMCLVWGDFTEDWLLSWKNQMDGSEKVVSICPLLFHVLDFLVRPINILLEKNNPSLPQFDFPKLEFLSHHFLTHAVGSGQGF